MQIDQIADELFSMNHKNGRQNSGEHRGDIHMAVCDYSILETSTGLTKEKYKGL